MFTFDITTHLRCGIVKPRGPIEVNLRSLDERQLGPAVSWLVAGIPRMQRKLPGEFAGPLGLNLTCPAGTRVAISSDGPAITVTPGTDSTCEPRAIITSSTDDFLAWSTTRLPGSSWYRSRATVTRRPASSTPSTWSRGERSRIRPDAGNSGERDHRDRGGDTARTCGSRARCPASRTTFNQLSVNGHQEIRLGDLVDVELGGRASVGRAHLAVDHSHIADERISAKSSPAGEQNGRGGDL
jgi:hypothetical protein